MSLMDVKGGGGGRGPQGLDPPAATPRQLWRDLRWHARLYRLDGLERRTRWGFLVLRVLQRLAYNLGWRRGIRP